MNEYTTREELKKMLAHDTEVFLANGGKIQYCEEIRCHWLQKGKTVRFKKIAQK